MLYYLYVYIKYLYTWIYRLLMINIFMIFIFLVCTCFICIFIIYLGLYLFTYCKLAQQYVALMVAGNYSGGVSANKLARIVSSVYTSCTLVTFKDREKCS